MSEGPKIVRDVAIPLGQTEAGHLQVARIQRNDEGGVRVLSGEVHPVQDGVPLAGDLVSFKPLENTPFLEVETLVEDPQREARERRGQVRSFSIPSPQFQAQWDRIFNPKPPASEVN